MRLGNVAQAAKAKNIDPCRPGHNWRLIEAFIFCAKGTGRKLLSCLATVGCMEDQQTIRRLLNWRLPNNRPDAARIGTAHKIVTAKPISRCQRQANPYSQ
jgi:hypothetical protein